MMKIAAFALTIAAFAGCDQVADISQTCSLEFVGAEINPSDLYPNDGIPDHRRWVAAKMIGTCTSADMADARVQLFGTNPDAKFFGYGHLDSVDWKSKCATWIWSATNFADLDTFLVTIDNGKPLSTMASINSTLFESWLPGSHLPAWKVDGEWSLYLPHPKHQQGCEPVE